MPRSTPIILTMAALASCMSMTVQAKDGFYLGTTASNATLSHTIERNTGSNTSTSLSSLSEETDFGFGISAGYQFHLSEDFFLAGEVFYQDQNVETRNINNVLVTELSLNESYGFKVKAGVDVSDRFSVYGLIGQTTLDFDINNSYTFAPPTRSDVTDVDEFTIGVGAQYNLNDHWSLVAEYNQLNDVNFDPIPEVAVPGKINDNQLDFSALSFGVAYRF